MKLFKSVLLLLILSAIFLPITNSLGEPVPDPEIVAHLQEIVTLREENLQRQSLLADEGRAYDLSNDRILLCAARIALARETKELPAEIEQHREMIKLLETLLKSFELEVAMGKGDFSSLNNCKADLLEAKIALKRAENRKKTGE